MRHGKRIALRVVWIVIALSVLIILGGLYYLHCLNTQGEETAQKEEMVQKKEATTAEQQPAAADQNTSDTAAEPDVPKDPDVQEEPIASEEQNVESADAELEEENASFVSGTAEKQNGQGYGKLDKLQAQLQAELDGRSANWSVVVVDLSTQQTLVCDNAGTADTRTTAASLIKLYVMATAYDRIQSGLLTDTDALEQAISSMITVSSNDATNTVLSLIGDGDSSIGMQRVNAYCQEQGYGSTQINRLLGISNYSLENFTSAVDCSRILTAIYKGTCVSPAWSQKMLSLLYSQTVRSKIPAAITDQSGVIIGNKTGELPGFAEHDVAVVTGEQFQYVLCVLCENPSQDAGVIGEISHISGMVYAAFAEPA